MESFHALKDLLVQGAVWASMVVKVECIYSHVFIASGQSDFNAVNADGNIEKHNTHPEKWIFMKNVQKCKQKPEEEIKY